MKSPEFSPPALKIETEHQRHVRGLNVSVLQHLQKEFERDPYFDLSFVLSEYSQHRKEVDAKFKVADPPAPIFSFSTPNIVAETKSSAAVKPNTSNISAAPLAQPEFKFVLPPQLSSTEKPGPVASASGFSFGGSTGSFTFGTNLTATASISIDDAEGDNGDDGDEPMPQEPPTTVKAAAGEELEEKIYEGRCKIFVFKASSWVDLGIGALRISKHPGSQKKRLLIRSEGTGKILLNTFLFKDMSNKIETDKKSLTFLSLDAQGQLNKYLLRVKSPEDANSLNEAINSNKD